VLAAARAVADRDGMGAVSLRGVARELGVLPNALYTHVAGADDLLDALADDVLGDVRAPRRGGQGWDVAVRRALRAWRDVLVEHPALARRLAERPAAGPNAQALDERLRDLLAEGGIQGAEAQLALRALRAFVVGFAATEVAEQDPDEGGPPDAAAFDVALRWLVGGLRAGTAHEGRGQ
jgi:AcrR family transcriptional regulator